MTKHRIQIGVPGPSNMIEQQLIMTSSIGVLFVLGDSDDPEETREEAIGGLFQMVITTACGRSYPFMFLDFPRENLKCECGKEGCWVVKYE